MPNHNPPVENLGLSFLGGDDSWKDSIAEIDGARFYQVRITYESDIFTGLVPEVSAIAVAWYE